MKFPRVRLTVRRLMAALAVVALFVSVARTLGYYISPSHGAIHAEGNGLVAGIESWHARHGRYPVSLDEARLSSPMRYRGGFAYTALAGEFTLWIAVADGVHLRHTYVSGTGTWHCRD
jgi:hypothetical protein